jgi:Ca-activated chloride channel family protein
MNERITGPTLTSQGQIALQAMQMHADVYPALCMIELMHSYRNDDTADIEATYTFPLPSQATLLSLKATLGEKELSGRVVPRSEAETRYEEAVAKGDSAIRLTKVQDGLYATELGNLRPGESIVICIRYALLLQWEGNVLRLSFPTSVAPRYGNPAAAGVESHLVPVIDPKAEQAYSAQITLHGSLAEATVQSRTHDIALRRKGDGSVVSLAGEHAFADRDMVVSLTAEDSAVPSFACYADDDDGVVGLACFRLPRSDARAHPRQVKIVLDCSGSMAGDSIRQAKDAAIRALDALVPEDGFAITVFGSNFEHFSNKSIVATAANVLLAKRWLWARDANMGGTEMAAAIEASLSLPGASTEADLLLVTDGEVWKVDSVVARALALRTRLFVIGVGSSAAEGILRPLAERTFGAAVFVTPNENIADAVFSQFLRIGQQRSAQWSVTWPSAPLWQAVARPGALFGGDTVIVVARFAKCIPGTATLTEEPEGLPARNHVAAALPAGEEAALRDDLPRIVATLRLRDMSMESCDQGELMALAVRYQLVSSCTDYLMLHERAADDKASGLPEWRVVSHMLAAGWGGSGSVVRDDPMDVRFSCRQAPSMAPVSLADDITNIPAFLRTSADGADAAALPAKAKPTRRLFSRAKRSTAAKEGNFFETRIFEPSSADSLGWDSAEVTPKQLVRALNSRYDARSSDERVPLSLADLVATAKGMPDEILAALSLLVSRRWLERDVMLAFWAALLGSSLGDTFGRFHRRAILRATARWPLRPELVAWLGKALRSTTESSWDWQAESTSPELDASQATALASP